MGANTRTYVEPLAVMPSAEPGVLFVKSETQPGVWYRNDSEGCSCQATTVCKHMRRALEWASDGEAVAYYRRIADLPPF